jgi:hypothetical protein
VCWEHVDDLVDLCLTSQRSLRAAVSWLASALALALLLFLGLASWTGARGVTRGRQVRILGIAAEQLFENLDLLGQLGDLLGQLGDESVFFRKFFLEISLLHAST